jgi:hypothetical protein
MPSTGSFTRRFDLSRAIESYTLNDRFSDLSDGQIGITAGFARANELLVVDRANHANDKGTVVRVMRGDVPVAHFVLTRFDNKWDSNQTVRPGILEGPEFFLDRTPVPNHDYKTVPMRNPDWIFGAESIFEGLGGEFIEETQTIYREAVVNSGVFKLVFRGQNTVDLDWDATAGEVESALNDLGFQQIKREAVVSSGQFRIVFAGQATVLLNWDASAATITTALENLSNITDVTVTGTGSLADPWTIAFVDPAGNQELFTISDSTLNGNLFVDAYPTVVSVEGDGSQPLPWTIRFSEPKGDADTLTVTGSTLNGNLFIDTLAAGGSLDPRPWTRSFNPVSGLFHNTYASFQMVTSPLYLDSTYSLEVNPNTPPSPTDYGGAQIIVNVDSGGFYRAEVPVFSPTAQPILFLIEDMQENRIMYLPHTTAVNTWEVLKIPNILLPVGIDQVIFRIAQVTTGDPGVLYISTEYALLAPGYEARTLGEILSMMHDALQTQGIFTWVTRTFTNTLDSNGVPWDRELAWGINHGQSLLQLHEYANKWNYRWGFEWSVANNRWEWHAYNPGTTLTTRGNIAITGHDGVIGSGTISTRVPEATHYQADGDGGEWGEYTDEIMMGAWGWLGKFFANAQGMSSAELDVLAERLVDHASEMTEGIMVELQNPDDLPWEAYRKGDMLTVNLEPHYSVSSMPVMAIVASKEAKQDPIYNIHFNSVVFQGEAAIYENVRRLNRKFAASQFNTSPGAVDPAVFGGGGATTMPFSLPGQAFVESGRLRFYPGVAGTVLGIRIAAHVAPTGASMIADINKNGVANTIFTTQANRPSIAAGTNVSAEARPDLTSFTADDYFTVDIDQVGSTIPGGDVTVMFRWQAGG